MHLMYLHTLYLNLAAPRCVAFSFLLAVFPVHEYNACHSSNLHRLTERFPTVHAPRSHSALSSPWQPMHNMLIVY